MIGTQLGRYRILDLIGRGGMGSVYRAQDETLGREVALKVLHAGIGPGDDRDANRFQREAQASASLTHPNVVTIHEVGKEDGTCFLAMELVRGESLRPWIDREKPVGVEEALGIIKQILSALEQAHGRGIVHRDIKSENIMVLPDGTIKVLDFGIAKVSGAPTLTLANEVLGTVEYMAPEQILGDEVGPHSDLYATGVVLYEILTGRTPFQGDSPVAVVYQQLNEEATPISTLNTQVPRSLEEIVDRLMAKEARDRYASASEALSAIEAFEQGDRIAQLAGTIAGQESVNLSESKPRRELWSRMVGRDAEFRSLVQAFERAKAGQGGVVFIGGEAGVGKTRLSTELMEHARRQGASTLTGACYYRQGMLPYLPFIDGIAALFKQDIPEEEREELKAYLREQAPELLEVTDRFSTMIELSGEQANQPEVDPETARQRLFEAISGMLGMAARKRPLVFLLDDAHWADDASLKLLHYLCRSLADRNLLILVTYRTEEIGADEEGHAHQLEDVMARMSRQEELERIRLERLSKETFLKLIKAIFRRVDFPEDFTDVLYGETQGNPFFVIEALRLLKNQQVLSEEQGMWTLSAEVERIGLSDRVQDVILRRIEGLSEEKRELLQAAAVVGNRFESDVLVEVAGVSRMALLKMLYKLEKKHGILQSEKGVYAFDHPQVREVLYNELPEELREEVHRMVGFFLLEKHAEKLDRVTEELAQHFFEAREYQEALPYVVEAGERANRLFAFKEAARYFERGLTCLDEGAEGEDGLRKELLSKSGWALDVLGQWERSQGIYQQLLDVSVAQEDVSGAALARNRMGWILYKQGQFEEALSIYREGLEGLGTAHRDRRAAILNNMGSLYFEQGEHGQSEALWKEALGLFETEDNVLEAANTTNNLAVLAAVRGQLAQGMAFYEKSEAYCTRIENLQGLARVRHNQGMLYADQGEWEKAKAAYAEALELSTRMRDMNLIALIHQNAAEAHIGAGELDEARERCIKALHGFRKLGDPLGIADTFKLCGIIARSEHKLDQAQAYFEQSLSLNREVGSPMDMAETLVEWGILYSLRDEPDQALENWRESEQLFEQLHAQRDLDRVRTMIRKLAA